MNITKLRKSLRKHNLELIFRAERKEEPLAGRSWSPDWWHLPSPVRDIYVKGIKHNSLYTIPEDHHCGTINLNQYRQWWPKDSHTKAKQNGMIHRVLVVPAELVAYYKKQCVFPRNKATIIGSINKDNSIRVNKAINKILYDSNN
jgi:hypothetical protein